MRSIISYLRKTWVFSALLFFVGLSIALLGENQLAFMPFDIKVVFWQSVTTHIGIACMVAAIVGILLELREMTDFFEKRLLVVLLGEPFFRMLSHDKLHEMNALTMEKLNRVDNPDYEALTFPETIKKSVVSGLGQMYRDKWTNTINHEILTQDETKVLFGSDPVPALSEKVVRITVDAKYDLISPHRSLNKEAEVAYLWTVRQIPGLALKQHWNLSLKLNGKEINFDINRFINTDEVGNKSTLNFSKKFSLIRKAVVEYKVTMYQYGDSGCYSAYFEGLTHNARVHFSSLTDKSLNLMADIYGLKESEEELQITPSSINMSLKGWALPGHGYYITWS